MNLVASYTMLRNYENCPRKAHHIHVLKDLPKEDSEAMRWGIAVHKAMEQRINHGTALPKEMEAFEPIVAPVAPGARGTAELDLGIKEDGSPCGFFDKGVWLRGKLDVVLQAHDRALLLDWKTGKPREEPEELRIQGVLLKAHFPEVRTIKGRYVWLAEKRLGKEHDVSDTAETLESIRRQCSEIVRSHEMKHWPPKQNPLCGWCPVSSCEFNRRKA